MKVWIKNTYFVIAVLGFLSASVFFILLASGYNYNFLKNKFEKTSTAITKYVFLIQIFIYFLLLENNQLFL